MLALESQMMGALLVAVPMAFRMRIGTCKAIRRVAVHARLMWEIILLAALRCCVVKGAGTNASGTGWYFGRRSFLR